MPPVVSLFVYLSIAQVAFFALLVGLFMFGVPKGFFKKGERGSAVSSH